MEKVLELAKKLKALADRGVDGEKESAQAMLEKLMAKHGITIDMIETPDIGDHQFLMEDKDYRFWRQVVSSVLGKGYDVFVFPIDRRNRRKLKRYQIRCTGAQAIEIQAKFDFFKKIYEDEQEIFYSAFIQKNKLYAKPKEGEEDRDAPDLTPEELDRLMRMMEMMGGMKRHHFLKQLGK